jgi:D-alanine-D-alanine ligase
MNARHRVVVLLGATNVEDRPGEADTCLQAELVEESLGRLGFDAEILMVDSEQATGRILKATEVDLAFNLVETLRGEGRLAWRIPRMLDALGIRYSGCGADALAATSAKTEAKRRMRARDIPTPEWSVDGGGLAPSGRVIVKPVWEDASVGIDAGSVVEAAGARRELASRAARFGGTWFVERYVDGREFSVSVLDGPNGPEVLPAAEILFLDFPAERPRIVDYEAKWITGGFAYHHTPRRFLSGSEDEPVTAQLRDLALRCWSVFGLSGYARVDFRVDPNGRAFVLEVNGNPCLSPDAGFMAAAARARLGFDVVIARIVKTALTRALPGPVG